MIVIGVFIFCIIILTDTEINTLTISFYRANQHRGPSAGESKHDSSVLSCQQHPEQSVIIVSSFKCFQSINVDWVHVESRACDIAKSGKGIQLVLGQLIDE